MSIKVSGRILYTVSDNTYVIKLLGDIRVSLCATLDAFLDGMFADDRWRVVLIDASETDGIDSTGLGLLAKIALYTSKKQWEKPVIFSTNSCNNKLFESMGFAEIFTIVEEVMDEKLLEEVDYIDSPEKDVCLQVLDAHKTLMRMNDKNYDTFKEVVMTIESQCENLNLGSKPK